ncbi:MAG: ABC transporter permease [Candidatus Shapirobacteria bacterium]|jgi:ABC-2 type transport system permease protein
MKKVWIIALKEWHYLFSNPVGYIFAGILLLVAGWLFMGDLFLMGQADMKPYWNVVNFLLSVFVPAVVMGSIADEKKNGTWEVILSTPIRELELVAGKMLGYGMYLGMVLLLTLPITITLLVLGKPDVGPMIGGYIGTLLLALAYLAVGLFFSSISSQAIVAFLATTITLILNNLIGQESVLMKLPTILRKVVEGISLSSRSARFADGVIEISSLVFFVSWLVVFTMLTVVSLKTRDK